MPIINRGHYSLDTIFDRQVGNDWPTAQVISTADVVETTNLYFTDERAASNTTNLMQSFQGDGIIIEANGRISANVVITLDNLTTDNLTEGSNNLYFSNARALAAIDGQNLNLNDLVIYGDLTVEGNTTTLNTATLIIEDKNIVLANGAVDSSAADGAGITIDGAQANITYQQSGDQFVVNKDLTILGNVFVDSITSNTWSGLIAGNNIVIEANGRISADVSSAGSAETANSVQSLSNFTSDNLTEGNVNLYYSNARARSAFSPGKNITIVNGIISSRDQDIDFNLSLDGFKAYRTTSSLASAFDTLTINTDERVLMKSIYVTNISESAAYLKSNLALNDGNSVTFAHMILVPAGASLELLKRDQVFSYNDVLNIQGFDSSKTPASDSLDIVFTYQSINSDESYTRAAVEVKDDANVLIYDATETYAILESIRIVNIDDAGINVSKLYVTDANDLIQAHFAYNLAIPSGTSVELLTKPKRLNEGYKIYANKTGANCSVLVSLRKGETLNEILPPGNVNPGSNITVTFVTNLSDGTQVYYEIA